VTIRVTNADDNPVIFLQYLYEVLIDSNTPKVRALKLSQSHSKEMSVCTTLVYNIKINTG